MTIPKKTVLVLGAYGLIGQGIAQKLLLEGHRVIGLGRNLATAQRVLPGVPWICHDMTQLTEVSAWRDILSGLSGVSAVVNCSGALQDGPGDNLEALHHHAVAALAMACAQEGAACKADGVALIQISAVGARPDASTAFLASKGRGDAAIRAAGGVWHIFRPGLVLAPNAYGGTALLRMLAVVPWVQPMAKPDAKIQTVSLEDVAAAVAAALNGTLPQGVEVDLVEAEPQSLRDVIAQIRRWLGIAPARWEIVLPDLVVPAVSKLADFLSHLGWRSPLRSTAVTVLTEGVLGTPGDLTRYGLPPATPLERTLRRMPVGAQDRLFARMALLAPLMILCLSLFWLASGLVGIVQVQQAAQVLQDVGWAEELTVASVLFWAAVDIAIGTAFAFRKTAPAACWAAFGVSAFYLAASTLTVPALWLDPLGPLVKVVPSMGLALVARAALETR